MYSLTFHIDLKDTDANRIKGHNRFKVHELYKGIKKEIDAITRKAKPEEPLENFKLAFTRYATRELDYDNFIASLKPYIDGLVLSGIIKDDSWKFIKSIEIDQVKSKEKMLVIRIEEAK